MPLKQILKVALISLRTNKSRSVLTMLGVIIGVASVILLVSFGSGLQKYITDQLEGIGSNLIIIIPGKLDLNKLGSGGGGGASFMNSKLTEHDAENIKSGSPLILSILSATVTQWAIKFNDQKIYAEVVGTNANFPEVVNSPLSSGDYFTEAENRAGRKVAILGAEVATELFGGDDPIDQKVIIGENRFTVVGVLKNRGMASNTEDNVIIPLITMQRILNKNKVDAIYAKAINNEQIDLAIEDVKLILSARLEEDDFTIMTQKDILGAVSSILGMVTAALAGIATISLVVGGIGIMNIMLVSVTERTKEIGLRKALGATPNIILSQFLIEAVILSVGGGTIGIIIGGLGAVIISQFAPAQLTVWAVLLAFGVSALVGIIFGVMPARKAAHLQPIEALRFE